jgi:heme/copper-type cytochrome/quinol oxidase subunit 2
MSSEPSGRLPSRFSLRTLLLVTVIAALSVTVWKLYAELRPMREEMRRLRNEVGHLSIEDETKVHAIAVPTDGVTWKWRIWIPEGAHYELHSASENIPKSGVPQNTGMQTIGASGEHRVEYQIRIDPRTGKWMDKCSLDTGSVGSSQQDWVDWTKRMTTNEGVFESTKVFEPKERVVLRRFRVGQVSSSSQIPDPSAGFMIWLEPVP